MKLLTEIIDLKITALYSFMILLFAADNLEFIFKVISGFIFIGYNLHRWYIMHDDHKKSKNKTT